MTIAVVSMIREPWGGSEELWYSLAKESLSKGIRFIHIGFEHPTKHQKVKELEQLGMLRIDRPGWLPPTNSLLTRQLYLIKNFIRKKVRSPFKELFALKPDIILYNGTCYSIAQEKELIEGISKNKIPFYIIGHLNVENSRPINDREALQIKNAYCLCKKVFFVSQRNLDVARRHLCTNIENARIIKNPVNLSEAIRLPYPPLNGKLQLACVGNLVTIHKGQDILLEALSKITDRSWHLNIYGSGLDRKYLEQLVDFLGLKCQVTFHGTEKDVRKIWLRNHALLLSSHMEGMPLVVVEAMLCGRPCITTDVGGISEWVIHGQSGFLAESTNVRAIQSVIENAFAAKESWSQMGDTAFDIAKRMYDPVAGATLLKLIIDQ